MKNSLHFSDEPKGWRELQQQALAERSTKKLAAVLKCMEQILKMHECETARRELLTTIKLYLLVSSNRYHGRA
jgi:hypothetical protein